MDKDEDLKTFLQYQELAEEQMSDLDTKTEEKLTELPKWIAFWAGRLFLHKRRIDDLEERSLDFKEQATARIAQSDDPKYAGMSKRRIEELVAANGGFKKIRTEIRREKKIVEYLTEVLGAYKFQFGKSLAGILEHRKLEAGYYG